MIKSQYLVMFVFIIAANSGCSLVNIEIAIAGDAGKPAVIQKDDNNTLW